MSVCNSQNTRFDLSRALVSGSDTSLPVIKSCQLSAPDETRKEEMKQECVSKWMTSMSESKACVRYFSGVASGTCSSAEIQQACEVVSSQFTVDDAERLCSGLQQAHGKFWPDFWRRQKHY